MMITRAAYEKLVAEDLAWLEAQPPSLVREHVIVVVKASIDLLYPPARVEFRPVSRSQKPNCIACPDESVMEAVYGSASVRCCENPAHMDRAAELAQVWEAAVQNLEADDA